MFWDLHVTYLSQNLKPVHSTTWLDKKKKSGVTEWHNVDHEIEQFDQGFHCFWRSVSRNI